MRKPPLIAILVAGIIAASPPRSGAQGVQSAATPGEHAEGNLKLAQDAIAEGDKNYKGKHYDVAVGKYQFACDHLPETPSNHKLRAQAINGFSMASVRLAEERIAEGRFDDAKRAAMLVLDPKYNPTYKPAIALLANLGGPESVPPRKDSGPRIAIADSGSDESKTESIRNKLDHIIIPQINFKEATVRDAIDFLHRKSIELDSTETDPTRRGVNIVLKLDLTGTNNAPSTNATGSPTPGGSPVPDASVSPVIPAISPGDTRITLTLSNIPLSAALDYVTKLAGLKMKVGPDGVIITPIAFGPEVLMTKEYKVAPGFLQSTGQNAQTARELLEKAGVAFPNGADANYDPAGNKLVVRNTEDNLGQVDEFIKTTTPPFKAKLEQAAKAAAAAIHKTETVRNKLDSIIIPEIGFHEATVRDAVEFLRKKSIALDTDPAHKGVNIVMRVDFPPGMSSVPEIAKAPAAPGISPAVTKISLLLKNIPLSEALRYVTELAGLRYRITPSGVLVVPLSEPTDSLPTKEYYVPPDYLQSTGGGATTAQEFLEKAGAGFPTGASAEYIPALGKLLVRNTEENLDLVDLIVEAATPHSKADLQEADRIAATTARNAKALRNKLDHIVIPKIEFREATLSDVLFDLIKILPEFDTTEAKPARRGVNFVWNRNANPQISLSLAKATLGEVLRQVAGKAGKRVKIDPYAIVIAPLSDYPDDWSVKEYKVPPGFPANALKDGGVQFPEGAAESFFPATGTLIVSNTVANMEMADQIVEAYINEQSAVQVEKKAEN